MRRHQIQIRLCGHDLTGWRPFRIMPDSELDSAIAMNL
jgi:hypothetical protein